MRPYDGAGRMPCAPTMENEVALGTGGADGLLEIQYHIIQWDRAGRSIGGD